MTKGLKKGRFGFLSSIVSDNPKKVLTVIIVFTIIMGYFASGMSMETREESFNPESKKGDWLAQVREDFGSSGESVQVAFVADNGDVFTREVLLDMINTKIAMRDDEVINSTLMESDDMMGGSNTLADTIVFANLTLQIQDFVVSLPSKTNSTKTTFETQYQINQYMNSSLSSASSLMSSSDPDVAENSTQALVSMADIISNPYSWAVTYELQSDLANLSYALQEGSTEEVIYQLDVLITKLNGLKDAMAGTDMESSADRFLDLFVSSKSIFETSPDPSEHQQARSMLLSFLAIGGEMGKLDMDSMSMDLSEGLPSMDLTLEDKKQMIENMSDSDIKKTVMDVMNYDPTELNESIDEILNDFTSMQGTAGESIDVLEDMNETLSGVISTLQAQGDMESVSALADYQKVVVTNKTMMEHSIVSFEETSTMMQSSRYISTQIFSLKDGITMSVSKDFEPTNDLVSIRAESAIGLIRMNSSVDRDTRLEAQQNLIELSKDVSSSSRPRIFASQVMMEEISESANRSLQVLLPIAFVFVVIVLFLVYRTIIETALSLLALGFAIVWTFGAGVLLGYEFNPMIIAVPVLITGLVIDYGIHMVMRHREEREDGYNPADSTHIAISTVGGALFLTTFTTVIGFLSNTFSSLKAMQQFGILAAVGISSSFILMVAGLPAVLQLIEEWREKKGEKRSDKKINKLTKEKGKDIIGTILSIPVDTSDKHPVIVILIVVMITGASLYGVFNIDTTFDIEDFLPEDKPQSENIKYISEHYNISTSYAYILTEGDLAASEYLHAVDQTMENLKDDEMVSNPGSDTSSVLTVLQSYGTATPGSLNYN
ncbi:MAG: MMPL family transporter, partial [Thermoplasmatota archaeon]